MKRLRVSEYFRSVAFVTDTRRIDKSGVQDPSIEIEIFLYVYLNYHAYLSAKQFSSEWNVDWYHHPRPHAMLFLLESFFLVDGTGKRARERGTRY